MVVGSTPASEIAIEALGMCRTYGTEFVKSNYDLDLAQKMLIAATAGKAINITNTSAHAWSYGFTKVWAGARSCCLMTL